MKRIFILILIALVGLVWANNLPELSNQSFSQRTDGSRLIDVYYDVFDADGDTLTVSMLVSDDDFSDFEIRASFANTQTGEMMPPAATILHGNYPNPFNPETTIDYDLAEAGQVNIDVYNIKGQKVASLLNEVKDAGKYSLVWNADDFNSGIYFIRLKTDSYSKVRKAILLK
jgi:hypothetical protein